MQKLKQILILEPKAVMNGFCYMYSLALFVKVQNLVASNNIFRGCDADEKIEPTMQLQLSDIGSATIYALSQQISLGKNSFYNLSLNEINEMLETAEEFLAIFQKK